MKSSYSQFDVAINLRVSTSLTSEFPDERVLLSSQAAIRTPFRPQRFILSEHIVATYGGANLADKAIIQQPPYADDLAVCEMVGGEMRWPGEGIAGVSGPALMRAPRPGFPLPLRIDAGQVEVIFAIERSVFERARLKEDDLALGYEPTPRSLSVTVRMSILGKSLLGREPLEPGAACWPICVTCGTPCLTASRNVSQCCASPLRYAGWQTACPVEHLA